MIPTTDLTYFSMWNIRHNEGTQMNKLNYDPSYAYLLEQTRILTQAVFSKEEWYFHLWSSSRTATLLNSQNVTVFCNIARGSNLDEEKAIPKLEWRLMPSKIRGSHSNK
jgi:hypothetical protein